MLEDNILQPDEGALVYHSNHTFTDHLISHSNPILTTLRKPILSSFPALNTHMNSKPLLEGGASFMLHPYFVIHCTLPYLNPYLNPYLTLRKLLLRSIELLDVTSDMPSESVAALQARTILERIALRRNLHQEEDGTSSRKEGGGDGNEMNASSSLLSSSLSSSGTASAAVLDHISDSRSDSGVSTTTTTTSSATTTATTNDDDDDVCNRYDVYVLKSSTDTDTNQQQQRYHMERRTI